MYFQHARLKRHVASMDGGLEAKIHEGGKPVTFFSLFIGFYFVPQNPLHYVLKFYSSSLSGGLEALLPRCELHEEVVGTWVTRVYPGDSS